MDTNDPASSNDFLCYDVNRYECAWEITQGSEDIVVAVVDNFSRLDHPDMVGKYAYVDDVYAPSNIIEGHHGITIAGIIAAVPNNDTCHAGVGYNTKLAIYDLDQNGFCNGIGGGVRKAIADGYKIISTSCSGVGLTINEITEFINDGGVYITAAISSDDIARRRAREIDGFINVGSMIWNSTENEFENKDTKNCGCPTPNVDIFVYNQTGRLYSNGTCNTGEGGTSMCSPQIAGVVALMRSVNPCITGRAIERIIQETGFGNILNAEQNCHPKAVDAEAAVLAALDYVPDDVVYDAPAVIQDLYPEGHVILEAGADVRVTGTIKMHHEMRIVVKRGARLHIDGGEVKNSFCTEDWKGIFVEGNSVDPDAPEDVGLAYVPQPDDPFGPLVADQPGILILNNGATIRNARFGAEMQHYWYDYPWPTSNNYYGGLLYADNATFIGCKRRGPLFSKYEDEHSVIKNCRFEENQVGIAMWSNGGPDITSNEFIRQVSNDVFSINSGPKIYDGNTFEGDPSSLFFDARISALNTHPNSPGVPEIGRENTTQNEFFNLTNRDAIRLDGGALEQRVFIINNEFRDGSFGVTVQGESWFMIQNNRFYNLGIGVLAYGSGGDDNEIVRNRFEGNGRGISATNDNMGLHFPLNCFESNASGIYISTDHPTSPPLPPSVRPVQRGWMDHSWPPEPSDCCFEMNGGDISGADNYGVLFRYVVDENLNLQDCRVPDQASGLFINFTTARASQGIMCDILPTIEDTEDPTELDELLAIRDDLLLQLQQLGVSDLHPDHISDLIQSVNQYLEIVEIRIINRYLQNGQDNEATQIRNESLFEDVRLAYYGALVNHGRWTEARQELASMNPEGAGYSDFRIAQELWLDKLEVGDRSASDAERQLLYAMGIKTHKYAGWIRGVYAALTQETIRLELSDASSIEPENRSAVPAAQFEARIFPNPASNQLRVEAEGMSDDGSYTLSIFSMDGRLVSEQSTPLNRSIDMSDVQAGVYVAVIKKDGAILYQERIVIVK